MLRCCCGQWTTGDLVALRSEATGTVDSSRIVCDFRLLLEGVGEGLGPWHSTSGVVLETRVETRQEATGCAPSEPQDTLDALDSRPLRPRPRPCSRDRGLSTPGHRSPSIPLSPYPSSCPWSDPRRSIISSRAPLLSFDRCVSRRKRSLKGGRQYQLLGCSLPLASSIALHRPSLYPASIRDPGSQLAGVGLCLCLYLSVS